MEKRGKRYPFWYYGMIAVTLLASMAGVYFRGSKVQGEFQTDRIAMGLLVLAISGLVTWAFRSLLKEIRDMGRRVGVLADGVFVVLLRESRNHPEDEEVEILLRSMIRERDLTRFRSHGDD